MIINHIANDFLLRFLELRDIRPTNRSNKITWVNSGMFILYSDTLKHEFTP